MTGGQVAARAGCGVMFRVSKTMQRACDTRIVALTLREILALPVLMRAKPLVVAGERYLDNPVRWLHVSEQEDVASYLHGGELLLTTGMRFAQVPAVQRRFVTSLVEAGVAGLVVRLGGSLAAVPPTMIETAERVGLPLVALRRRIAFVDAMEDLHRTIVSEQSNLLRRATEMRSEFTDLVLQGSSVQEVADRLADLLRGVVVVADAAHRPVYIAESSGNTVDRGNWSRHSRFGHADPSPSLGVRVESGDPHCAWVPLVMGDEPWGRLHMLRSGGTFDELDRMAVERAASAVVLAMMSERRATQLRGNARAALLTELIEDRLTGAAQFRRRAKTLGVDLAGVVVSFALTSSSEDEESLQEQHEDRRAVEATARAVLCQAGNGVLSGWYQDTLITVASFASGSGPRPEELAELLLMRLGQQYSIGISEPLPNASSRQAVLQSLESVRAAAAAPQGLRLRHFRELGLDSLLRPSVRDPELSRFVEAELGPLLSHDVAGKEPLLPVLRALLAANGRVGRAAEDLGIDRRTLAARIPVLERILQIDLQSFDAQLRLSVAVHALDLLPTDPADLRV